MVAREPAAAPRRTLAPAPAPEDLNRRLWVALVTALAGFARQAAALLEIRQGQQCPRCGHRY